MSDNESINKLVFSSAEDALANLSMPEEALKLLMNIKEADKKVESEPQKNKAIESSSQEPDNMISKMSFNPETGFTFDPSILAKLSLNSTNNTNVSDNSISYKVEDNKAEDKINISKTSEYTKEEANALVRSFNINEEGMFLGIVLGSSDKSRVLEIMGKHSDIKYDSSTTENILDFEDLSIIAYFDDENIINQLEFGKNFRGNTSKGLKIGDTLEKATELYGNPMMKSPKGAVWKGLKVFFTNGEISSIKIQKV